MRIVSFALNFCVAATLVAFCGSAAEAQITEFSFQGNGGVGLLPGNEVGPNTATAMSSTASGGEIGGGVVFDASTNILSLEFDFEGLEGGLAVNAAGGGIHLHLPNVPGDPFNSTGGIQFFLNNGSDANVTNNSALIADGAAGGSVDVDVSFANDLGLVDDLLAGEFYLNIHSGQFPGGELRGTLVAIPEPTALVLLSLGACLVGASRRR